MIPTNRIPAHPGEVLLEDFLRPMNLAQTTLANKLGIPVQRINEIVNGKRGITPETAFMFAGEFGTTPQFWTTLQANYDLSKARPMTDAERAAEIVAAMDHALASGDPNKLTSVLNVIARNGWGGGTPLAAVIHWVRKAVEEARTMATRNWPPPAASRAKAELKKVARHRAA